MTPKVLIPTKLDAVARQILEKHGFPVVQDSETPFADLCAAHTDTGVLIVRSEKVPAALIDSLPALRVVVRAGAGYDTIDVKHARRHDVDVMNTPGANANAVAEEVVALILAAYRHVIAADKSTREGGWEKKKFLGRELYGKTVGIVGLGNIGQLLVRRLSGFACTVIGYDPVISSSRADELGVQLCPLDDLFTRADIVSLHVPETDETRGFVNEALLRRMKDGAMLVNCARAGIIDEEALRRVKPEKKLIFCNDVYAADTAGPKSVADIADVMLPHLGANTKEANITASRRAAEQVVDYFQRGVSRFVVNRAVPEGLDPDYQKLAYYLTRVAHRFLNRATQPRRIEASFYGELKQYEEFLVAPIVLGLSADFDPLFDHSDAEQFLRTMGIEFTSREVDNSKKYGNTITIDLMEGTGRKYTRVSLRGTITEGRAMISRIDDFDRLYFEPMGHIALVTYQDQPGMLSALTGAFARNHINIDDIRSSIDTKTGDSLVVLKAGAEITPGILDEILRTPGMKKAISLELR